MELYTVTYTAKPLSGGWYRIYKNTIPLEKNRPGIGYNNPVKTKREALLKTKNPKKILYALGRQVSIIHIQ